MTTGSWRTSLLWGFGLALASRAALTLMHGTLWLVFSGQSWFPRLNSSDEGNLPVLGSTLEHVALGVWRRWDAIHYLTLGSTTDGRAWGESVFGPATPAVFRAADAVLPGPIDLAAAVVQVVCFALALAMLWQFCSAYFGDDSLGRYAALVTAILPLSYIFYAPTSESLYLLLVLTAFYAAVRCRWLSGAVSGALAVLTRFQAAILVLPMAALLFEQRDRSLPWRQQVFAALRSGWPIALIPLTYLGFMAARQALAFPPLNDLYAQMSYVFFVHPLEGLWLNLRWALSDPASLLTNSDILAMVVYTALTVLMLRNRRFRTPLISVYTLTTLLVLITKINYRYGTDEVLYTQSFARYALALWPVHIYLASLLLRARPIARKAALLLMASVFLIVGTVNMFYLAPA